jgi:hypothetical protein
MLPADKRLIVNLRSGDTRFGRSVEMQPLVVTVLAHLRRCRKPPGPAREIAA